MSGVSVGRLEMFTLKVISPASSFETSTLVMSGAAASSPAESGKLWAFVLPRSALPSAAVGRRASKAPPTIRIIRRLTSFPPR